MKIKYIRGDLITTDCEIIAHGCNSRGVMGSGIALQIKNHFPKAYFKYKEAFNVDGLTVGTIIWGKDNDKLIANCITQITYGRDKNTRYVSYKGIRSCMKELNKQGKSVAMPMIGAGLGGGNWNTIAEIIEQEFIDSIPVVYHLNNL